MKQQVVIGKRASDPMSWQMLIETAMDKVVVVWQSPILLINEVITVIIKLQH
jgi:hypothetical protein